MQKHEENLAARINGNALQPLAGASVTVTDDATGLPAALYSDDGVTPLAQPVITGNEGEYAFYAANGEYTVTFSGTRFATFTRKVILADPSDNPYLTQAAAAAPSGAAQVGFAMASGEGTTVQAALRAELTNVNLHFIAAEADHTGMVNRASAAARRVYFPAGAYNINAANWPSNTEFFGDGDSSILNQAATSQYLFTCDSGSPSVANNIVNLRMRNLQLRATSDVDGFSEFAHLVSINGVSNVLFEHVLFKGFRGDGLYIGSSNVGGTERHNTNVTVKRCRFDGINRENRNAISIIDGDGVLIEGCEFKNCTKSTMPGPIDMEPDVHAWPIIRNVTIARNKFTACGGNVAEVAVYVSGTVASAPSNIVVRDNVSTGYLGSGYFATFDTGRLPSATSEANDYKLIGNNVRNGSRAFGIFDGKRVTVSGNTFADMPYSARIGGTDETRRVRDMLFDNNRMVRCGSTDGNGLTVTNADYLAFSASKWIDCGNGTPGAANAIDFSTGTSSYVSFDACEWSAPTGKSLVAIQKEAGHTFNAATNRASRNTLNGLGSFFAAGFSDLSDVADTAWTPVASGATTAGAGTYTTQQGVYSKIMGHVTGSCNVAWSAHTGTGQCVINLPSTPSAIESGFIPVSIVGTITVAAGAQVVGMINSGGSRIQLYTLNAGALEALSVPASGALYISFSYAGQ